MANRWGNSGNNDRLYVFRLQNHCRWWPQPWNQKTLAPWKKSYDQSSESWVPKNWCFWTVVLEKTLESPLECKEIKPVNPKGNQSWIYWKDWCWSFNTLAMWWEELTHWKRFWCWERLKTGGEEDDRGWDGWMASPTGWTWVSASSRSWWWTREPGMLQSMGLQRLGHLWATELNWEVNYFSKVQ